MIALPIDRSLVTVVGAADVLAAALGAGSPRDAARRLRDLAPTLDLTEARATAQRDGRAAVIAGDAESGGALGVRWFAPGVATPVHDHGCWGAAVVVEGRDRYERFTVHDGTAVLDTTFWLEPGDVVWWLDPPGDVHRQEAAEGGATELVLIAAPARGAEELVAVGAAHPLAEVVLAAYRNGASPRCASTTATTCWSMSPCRPGASRSAGAPLLRGCSIATNWVCPICGCARSGPCRWSMAALSRSRSRARRGAETVQWRALHVLHVRDGKVAEHVTYCSGHADAAAIAGQDAEAAMVRP